MVKNKNKGQEGTSKNNQQQTSEQGEQVSEVSLIDMNNTENAKVEEGIKENTSKKLLEEKEYKGLKNKKHRIKSRRRNLKTNSNNRKQKRRRLQRRKK